MSSRGTLQSSKENSPHRLKPPQTPKPIPRVDLDFLPPPIELTIHHEPPKYRGLPKVEARLGKGAHAYIHELRGIMYNRWQDRSACKAQLSDACDAEVQIYNDLRSSPEKTEKLKEFIRRYN